MRNLLSAIVVLALALGLAMPVPAQDVSASVGDFAVVGYASVSTSPRVKVLPGSSQARIGSNGTLYLHQDNEVGNDSDGGHLQALGNMRIGPRSEIFGDVAHNGALTLDFEGTAWEAEIHGGVFPDEALEIGVPSCDVDAPGGPDLTLGWRETHTFTDGDDYGDFKIGPYGTLVFPPGVYSFQSLDVGQDTIIQLEAPVEIHVANSLKFGWRVHHVLTAGTVQQVVWLLGDGASFTSSPGRRSPQTELLGTYCGPGASVSIGQDYVLTGAVYADTVAISWRTVINSSTAFAANVSQNPLDFAVVGYSKTASNSVHANLNDKILPGSGQARVGTNGNLYVQGSAVIGDGAAGGHVQSLGNMDLGSNSDIFGDVAHNGTLSLGLNMDILGGIFPGAAPEIDLPDCIAVVPGGPDYSLPSNQSYEFTDGDAFGAFTTGLNNILTFPAGTYSFETLDIMGSGKIYLTSPVTIHIGTLLDLGSNTDVFVTGNPEDVLWLLEDRSSFKTGLNNDLVGTFCGPGATIDIMGSASVTGALHGATVKLGSNTTVVSCPNPAIGP